MPKVNLPNLKCKVNNLYNKNQFIIEITTHGKDYLIFQSYKSEIAIYCYNTRTLYVNEYYINYSKTTSKHLYIFINEFTPFSVHNLNELHQAIKENQSSTYRR